MQAHENPFRTERLHRLAFRAPDFHWPDFLAQLRSLKDRGLIVGPQGSGKTTLLNELAQRLEASGRRTHAVRLDPDDRERVRLQIEGIERAAGEDRLLLVDGGDRIGRVAWLRLQRRLPATTGFVLTAHQEGRLATLYRCQSSLETFCHLVQELIGSEAARELPLHSIYHLHAGNIRLAFLDLYDRKASDTTLD